MNISLLDAAFEDAQLGSIVDSDDQPHNLAIDCILGIAESSSSSSSADHCNAGQLAQEDESELEQVSPESEGFDTIVSDQLALNRFCVRSRCWSILSREYYDNITSPLIPAALIELKVNNNNLIVFCSI